MAKEKAKSKMVELEGIVEWAKLFEDDRDRAEWNKAWDGAYNLTIILDDKNAEIVKKSGTRLKLEEDPEGRGLLFRPKRKHKDTKEWASGAPDVAGPDGTKWDVEKDGKIGNGSRIRILISVYPTATAGNGTRLEAVQVIDHVRYDSAGGHKGFFKNYTKSSTTPDTEEEEEEEPVVRPSFQGKSKVKLDDSIPF